MIGFNLLQTQTRQRRQRRDEGLGDEGDADAQLVRPLSGQLFLSPSSAGDDDRIGGGGGDPDDAPPVEVEPEEVDGGEAEGGVEGDLGRYVMASSWHQADGAIDVPEQYLSTFFPVTADSSSASADAGAPAASTPNDAGKSGPATSGQGGSNLAHCA